MKPPPLPSRLPSRPLGPMIRDEALYRMTLRHLTALFSPYFGLPGDAQYIDLFGIWPEGSEGWARASLDDKPPVASIRKFPVSSSGIRQAALWCDQHREDFNIYCGILPKDGIGRGDVNVPACSALWGEVDTRDGSGPSGALRHLKRALDEHGLPPPDLICTTRGGCHFYYLLDRAYPLACDDDRYKLKSTLLRLSHAVGGQAPGPHADPAPCRPGGTLRPAGTYNHKDLASPVPILLTWDRVKEDRPDWLWWRCHLPGLPEEERPAYPVSQIPDEPEELPEEALSLLSGVPTGRGRNHDLTKLLGIAARRGWRPEMLSDLVDTFCQATSLSQAEGRGVLKSALRHFREFM